MISQNASSTAPWRAHSSNVSASDPASAGAACVVTGFTLDFSQTNGWQNIKGRPELQAVRFNRAERQWPLSGKSFPAGWGAALPARRYVS
jgi:hypothetical protein